MSAATPIRWGPTTGSRKRDGGHSPIRSGFRIRYDGRRRTFVLCECGTRLSGNGEDGGYRSWKQHAKRFAAKQATA